MDREHEAMKFSNQLKAQRIRMKRRKKITGVFVAVLGVVVIIASWFILFPNYSKRKEFPNILPEENEVLNEEIAEVIEEEIDTFKEEVQASDDETIKVLSEKAEQENKIKNEFEIEAEVQTTGTQRRGTSVDVPDEIRSQMNGLSMKDNPNISYEDLAYLTIPHYDFSYNVTTGHLIVNKKVAEELLDIFAELYDIKYPIERMELIDKYNADDFQSIEYNNTSAFNYRESTDGSGRLSKHALGLAIDINPQINPYVNSGGTGSHANAKEYWLRDTSEWTSDIAKAAYIGKDTEIYNIFVNKYGWEWGGAWSSYRDYQHFQKTI